MDIFSGNSDFKKKNKRVQSSKNKK